MNVGSSKIRADSGVLSEPFGLLRNGRYNALSTATNSNGTYGRYWISRMRDSYMPRGFCFTDIYLYMDWFYSGSGFAVRCVEIIISL